MERFSEIFLRLVEWKNISYLMRISKMLIINSYTCKIDVVYTGSASLILFF